MKRWTRALSPRAMLGEALIVVAAYVAYSALRVVVEGGEAAAVEHAFDLIAIEQALWIFHEAEIQQFVQGQPWLMATMDAIYMHAYLPFLIGSAIFVYLRDPELYRRYRNTMFISAAMGLVIFLVLPVAPPRMLPEYGFLDTVRASTASTSSIKNDFAAVPSFHFGFTLLGVMGIAHAYGCGRWRMAALSLAPATMLLSIVATGNHFFLDAVAGAAVVLAVWSFVVWPKIGAGIEDDDDRGAVPVRVPV